MSGILPGGGVLVDMGCGQGLMLALLAEAAAAWRAGAWTAPEAPPVFEKLVGIESRRRTASIAERALGADAHIVTGDARVHIPGACRAVLCFDVLHMIPRVDQERLLRRIGQVLDADGVILVREADAAAGARFTAVRVGNWLKALVTGNWRQTFAYRRAADWRRVFAEAGFEVQERTAGEGTPFGNVLFVLTRQRAGAAYSRRS